MRVPLSRWSCGWWRLVLLLLGLVPCLSLSASEEIAYYDLTPIFGLDLKQEDQRRRFWDETHLVIALQGLVNREQPRLFVRHLRAPDDFWWKEMTSAGGWLQHRPIRKLNSLSELLAHFRRFYRGTVLWDERVPSTSNLASTIAGCDDLLPLRFDPAPGSLCQVLRTNPALAVRVDLRQPDGSCLFTGQGLIPGTSRPTTGSAKADAYRWLIEHYVKTGKANPQRMGYYLDGFWLRCWKAGGPENHTLSNHDFVIAQRGVLFDLNVWPDEACVDEPEQKPGTDMATLQALLGAAYERFAGRGVIHVAGFVPWAYKYTTFKSGAWAAGGTHPEVPTEWRYAEILSCYNAYMDADALGLGAMANASFFQHYPVAPRYPQNPKPTRDTLIARGILDPDGRIPQRGFVAHYVGDYDAAAWLYRELPRMWQDPARGTTPLSWAFNPNLSERFPLGMAWARERRTTNDWFVAGDSGAGYLNPGYLSPPRPHSGLPCGLAAWEAHCRRFYERWDISLTGFVIDGFARGLTVEGLDAYARFSPDGIVAQQIGRQGVHGPMPYLRMAIDLPGGVEQAAQTMASLAGGLPPRFVVCRSILKPPSWYAKVESEVKKQAGDRVQVVDLYTLLWLVREYETNRPAYATSRFVKASRLTATPKQCDGLAALYVTDGPLHLVDLAGQPGWQVPRRNPGQYLYFDVADGFVPEPGRPLRLELEYLDQGTGSIVLEYDSNDAQAPHHGAYKAHPQRLQRQRTGRNLTAVFNLPDARFAGSQNGGADFRLYNGGDDLVVRRVTVSR